MVFPHPVSPQRMVTSWEETVYSIYVWYLAMGSEWLGSMSIVEYIIIIVGKGNHKTNLRFDEGGSQSVCEMGCQDCMGQDWVSDLGC